MIYADRSVEKADVWNLFFAAEAYLLHVADSFLRN